MVWSSAPFYRRLARMWRYPVKLGAAAIAFFLIGIVAIVIFGNIWARVGIGAAIVVIGGGLLLFAWNVDRKERGKRAGIDELPPV
jgi:Flp pilus assembly protein TadB